jgi:hypothetical protein
MFTKIHSKTGAYFKFLKMTNWTDFPLKLRLDILGRLIKDVRDNSSTSTDHLATFAVVCKEWQNIVERETFRQLVLTRPRLQDLYRNIKHRGSFVKHIWYNVELPEYPCGSACIPPELPRRRVKVCV